MFAVTAYKLSEKLFFSFQRNCNSVSILSVSLIHYLNGKTQLSSNWHAMPQRVQRWKAVSQVLYYRRRSLIKNKANVFL